MRRSLIAALLAATVLVAWPLSPVRSVALAADPPVSMPAKAMAASAPRPVTAGLCGTELERPPSAAASRRLPEDLRSLARGVPTAAAVAAAAAQRGIAMPGRVELEKDPGPVNSNPFFHPSLAVYLANSERARRTLEEKLARRHVAFRRRYHPLADVKNKHPSGDGKVVAEDNTRGDEAVEAGQDFSDPPLRISKLEELGRLREALALAKRYHSRDRCADSVFTLARILRLTGHEAPAQRLYETERKSEKAVAPGNYFDEELALLCAARGDFVCARANTRWLRRDTEKNLYIRGTIRGLEHTFEGKLDEAREAYLQALDLHLVNESYIQLAAVEGCLGRPEARGRWMELLRRPNGLDEVATGFAGLAFTSLRAGEAESAWILASGALVAGGRGTHSATARLVAALAALVMGDLKEARAQLEQGRKADPDHDLRRQPCFAHPAEAASVRALLAASRGDRKGAREAWIAVARSGHGTLAATARVALSELCP